jgi:cardiolipin-specific phospholipase
MRVLKLSGLPETAFKCRNVPLGDGKNYIRTIEMGDPAKPTMVLIHGYGGSSVKFWKIVGPLSEKYHLYMIDIIGMGASSRPTFDLKDPPQVDQYLTSWLEAWRRSVGLNKPFILAGHSFGGYLSGLYTL